MRAIEAVVVREMCDYGYYGIRNVCSHMASVEQE